MNSAWTLVLAFLMIVAVSGQTGQQCNVNADCPATHCCKRLPRINTDPRIVSRRETPRNVCKPYYTEGQFCEMNNRYSCGCAPGYECVTTIDKRSPPRYIRGICSARQPPLPQN